MKSVIAALAAVAATLLLALPATAATRPHDAFNGKHPGASAGWTSVRPLGSSWSASAGWT